MEDSNTPLLQITDLSIAYETDKEWLTAVQNFSLSIKAGETVGLVGESGSGKSTIALAVMGYLGANGRIAEGDILFNGRNLVELSDKEMGTIWGQRINLVPQDPQSALNPSLKIQEQLAEVLRQHNNLNNAEANTRAIELLDMVRVPDPARVADSYPHQISGGMQQRVMIAMALATEPPLLILDEPTTNLDVTTQAAVLDLFRDLIKERDTAVLYVTHNLGVVANMCDRVAVLYAGDDCAAWETGPAFSTFARIAASVTSSDSASESSRSASRKARLARMSASMATTRSAVVSSRCVNMFSQSVNSWFKCAEFIAFSSWVKSIMPSSAAKMANFPSTNPPHPGTPARRRPGYKPRKCVAPDAPL